MPTRPLVLILLVAFGVGAETLRAQESAGASVTVTPSIGLAAMTRNGSLESGGMSAYLEVDVHDASLLWSAYAGQRGIGVGCSDGCELGGQSIGLGVSYVLGNLRAGGGLGLLRRRSGWHVQPYGQLSVVHGMLRIQLRLEVPQGVNGVHVPLLFGLQLPIGL